jgi:hypothetical protein
LSGIPQAPGILEAVQRLGLPVVLTLLLVASLLGWVPSPLWSEIKANSLQNAHLIRRQEQMFLIVCTLCNESAERCQQMLKEDP